MLKRDRLPLLILLLVSLAIRIYDLFITDLHVWDGSTYIGIGKWFLSHGQVGYLEVFRPIILPLFEGAFWKIHIDTLVGGSVIAIISSLVLVAFVYAMGERMQKNAGLIGATLLAFTPVFLLYSHLAMSDVFSTAFMLLGVYFITKEKYFLSGLFVGLAMLTRFPQGLAAIVLALLVVAIHYRAYRFSHLGIFLKKALFTLLGFVIVVVPYFVWAYVQYGDPLLPMKEGNLIIGYSVHVYRQGTWFYVSRLFYNNPFLLFVPIGFIVSAFALIRKRTSIEVLAYVLGLLVYGIYFTIQPHKELRYALPFLPFAAGLAGYGMSKLFVRTHVGQGIIYLVLICAALGLSAGYYRTTEFTFSPIRTEYYAYFDKAPRGTVVIATEPMSYARGDTKLVGAMYDSWVSALATYREKKSEAQYVSIDSCVLESACGVDATCLSGKSEMLAELDQDGTKVFSGTEPRCQMAIYKLK